MEKYFDIRYEFDVPTVHKAIDDQIAMGKPFRIQIQGSLRVEQKK